MLGPNQHHRIANRSQLLLCTSEYDAARQHFCGRIEEDMSHMQLFYGHHFIQRLTQLTRPVVQTLWGTTIAIGPQELLSKARKIAQQSRLLLGLEQGDRVMMIADHHRELVPLVIGLLVAGAVLNPLHANYEYQQFRQYLEKVRPKVIICESRHIAELGLALHDLNQEAIVCCFDAMIFNDVDFPLHSLWYHWETEPVEVVPQLRGDPNDVVALLFPTENAGNLPQCVRISHAQLMQSFSRIWFDESQPNPAFPVLVFNDSKLASIAYFNGLATIISDQATLVTCPGEEDVSAHQLFRLLNEARMLYVYLDSQLLIDFLFTLSTELAGDDDSSGISVNFGNLKAVMTTGQVPANIYDEMRTWMGGIDLYSAYGTADMGGYMAMTYRMVPDDFGELTNDSEVAVVDEEGVFQPAGTAGELWVKQRSHKHLGYLLEQQLTAPMHLDERGWFHTGDRGVFDAQGRLLITSTHENRIKKRDILKMLQKGWLETQLEQQFRDWFQRAIVVLVQHPKYVPAVVMEWKADRSEADEGAPTPDGVRKYVEDNWPRTLRLIGGVQFERMIPRLVTGEVDFEALLRMVEKRRSSEREVLGQYFVEDPL